MVAPGAEGFTGFNDPLDAFAFIIAVELFLDMIPFFILKMRQSWEKLHVNNDKSRNENFHHMYQSMN